jgi:hypothetical protein
MKRRIFSQMPLRVFAGIFGFLSLCTASNAQVVVKQLSAYPLPSKARDALNEIAGQSDVLVLGEIHGTQEVPAVATALLEQFTKLGYGLLALEIPADQQGPLTDWATGKTATVPRFFTKEIEDGRGNMQVLSLIRSDADYESTFLEAAEQQAKSDTQPEDLVKLSVRRDADMAATLAKQRQKLSPDARVLAICGNVHARTANHSPPEDLMSKLWPSFAARLQATHAAWQIRSVNVVPLSGGYFAMTDPAEGELPRGKPQTIHATRKLVEAEALLLHDKDWNLELNLPRATPATFLPPAGAASRKPDSP